ncbi:unnamed protein product, partial [Gulo gulo]
AERAVRGGSSTCRQRELWCPGSVRNEPPTPDPQIGPHPGALICGSTFSCITFSAFSSPGSFWSLPVSSRSESRISLMLSQRRKFYAEFSPSF